MFDKIRLMIFLEKSIIQKESKKKKALVLNLQPQDYLAFLHVCSVISSAGVYGTAKDMEHL